MAKTGRQLVPRTHDVQTKTKAQFFGQFRSAIRKIWLFSAIRREALKRAKIAPGRYQCAHCKESFKSTEIEVDHLVPCGSLREFEDFSPFISKMFQEDISLLQILCKGCHLVVSNNQKQKS